MERRTCTMCNVEKHINNFVKRFSECRDCNRTRGLKRYYDNKDKISFQQKSLYEQNRYNTLLEKQNKRCIQNKGFVRSYVELENSLKAIEEKFKIDYSKNNQNVFKRNL